MSIFLMPKKLSHEFFPPIFFLKSEFFHNPDSDSCINDSHDCSDNNITRIVHAVMNSRKSHENYKKYPKRKKSFLEIGNNQNKKCRKCHMTRRK